MILNGRRIEQRTQIVQERGAAWLAEDCATTASIRSSLMDVIRWRSHGPLLKPKTR